MSPAKYELIWQSWIRFLSPSVILLLFKIIEVEILIWLGDLLYNVDKKVLETCKKVDFDFEIFYNFLECRKHCSNPKYSLTCKYNTYWQLHTVLRKIFRHLLKLMQFDNFSYEILPTDLNFNVVCKLSYFLSSLANCLSSCLILGLFWNTYLYTNFGKQFFSRLVRHT